MNSLRIGLSVSLTVIGLAEVSLFSEKEGLFCKLGWFFYMICSSLRAVNGHQCMHSGSVFFPFCSTFRTFNLNLIKRCKLLYGIKYFLDVTIVEVEYAGVITVVVVLIG